MSGRLLVAVATGRWRSPAAVPPAPRTPSRSGKLVADYGRALADGDGDRACRMLTADARAHIVSGNRYLGVQRCEDVAEVFHAAGSPEDLRELRRLKLGSVRVRGDRATARLVGLRALEHTDDARLRRVDGRWLIEGSTA
jgi:hypothetical protein